MAEMFRAELIGRAQELERLEAAARTAAEGTPRIVLLGGEAGVGKTSLLEEVCGRAARSGTRVLLGHCLELSGGGLPYGPVIEVGRFLARTLDHDTAQRLLAPAEAELARLLEHGGEHGASDQGPAPAFAQTRLFEYLLRILTELCQGSPVLLAAEDLHLADRSTLDLLSFLVRNLSDEPVMIVVTFRSEELPGHQPVREFLAEQGRDRRVQRIELTGFGREELTVKLGDLLGAPPSEDVVESILVRSGGNPFFTEELIASGLEKRHTRLPEKLSELILTRVARLSEDAQQALKVVAAADRQVSHLLVSAVVEVPERALLVPLREAVNSRLLLADATTQSYGFRHALVREAIYDDLQPADLAWLHGAIARALETDPTLAGDQVVTPAVELAHHWDAAGDRPRALIASVQAARSASAIFAFAEAHRQYERALRLWPLSPRASGRLGLARNELLQEASNSALWGEGVERALTMIDEALREVHPAREPARVGALLECQGRYLWRSGDNERSLAAHAEAVRLLADEPASPARARALAGYGRSLLVADRYVECRLICQDAVAMARTIGARREEGHALNTLGVARAMTGEVDAGIADLDESRRIAHEVGNFEDLYRAYGNQTFALENAGRVSEAVELALQGLAVARKHPETEIAAGALLVNATDQLFLLGRWREARELLTSAPHMKAGPRFGPYLQRAEAELDTAAGRFDLAEAQLISHLQTHLTPSATASRLTDPQFQGSLHAWLAELMIWRGDRQTARAAIDEGLRLIAQSEDDRLAGRLCALGLRADADEAEQARSVGDREAEEAALSSGAALLDRVRRLARRPGRQGTELPEATWAALLCEAEHARLQGRSLPGRWEAVVDASDALHHQYRSAYARWRYAEALFGEGAADDAAAVLRQSHDTAVDLGAEPLRELVESLARRHWVDLCRPAARARQ
jgi:tetratricopeptide (TPR) repeat protein